MADGLDVVLAGLRGFVRGEVIALGVNVNANLRDAPPLGTPIDTGWASANWVPSVGAAYGASPAEQPADLSPAQVAAANLVAEQGLNAVLGWDFNNGSIFSTNNVPYIRRLNDGSSTQSPSGFVAIAIEKALQETLAGSGSRARGNLGSGRSRPRGGR